MRVVSKAKARHQPAPHPGIQLVNHKGSSSTLTNRLLGTTALMEMVVENEEEQYERLAEVFKYK